MKIVIGQAEGIYHNEDVSKEFSGSMMAMVRKNGSIIVQNLTQGIRPICYIGADASTVISVDDESGTIKIESGTDDGQYLKLVFNMIFGFTVVPEGTWGDE
ncbi:MAG: hypothetical protein ACTSWQ_06695 [Candidatus Thorarchaeota archaeon]